MELKFANKSILTPEVIIGKLFSFHDAAHFLHLQTTSFAEHKALDETYKDLVDLKDDISEYLLGIMAPKRFSSIKTDPIPSYSTANVTKFAQDIFDFSVQLCDWADEKHLEELCNLSSDLQKVGVKLKYLLTLS
jgi:hypothetical protein